ncbi:unnamed protein product [Amoebophrya sp. A25]|nr:unnamed protein product [Amoebophrya sp. A25]|eukprot:GSA25T00000904001.1
MHLLNDCELNLNLNLRTEMVAFSIATIYQDSSPTSRLQLIGTIVDLSSKNPSCRRTKTKRSSM